MQKQKDPSKLEWLLFLDQKKAFDRVNHEYLQIVLERIGFDFTFRRLVNNLFARQMAHIYNAGKLSTSFRVKREVRLGVSLSPLLYIISFEPFLRALTHDLEGITLKKH
ncbi:21109_t:CDS:1 [Dentiscutata erythropus]|uniref:21109_t:CDS:1 n=1 Tax=Dentiscutata erythropus TaxID=1348616 RepID=A0A9N9GKN7_9GLOM|nr:21109_t:CDS:1 [Dentiscutata erythropus]